MKPKEIVRALRCISTPDITHLCNGCKYRKSNGCDADEVNKDAVNLIEQLTVENAALRKKVPQWIDVKDGLPKAHDNYGWEHCIVTVFESISSPFEEAYERKFVSTALFDVEQKIWHTGEDGAAALTLNALIGIEDAPLNGYCVSHWMTLPEVAKEGDHHEPET